MHRPIRIAIAEDHTILRQALVSYLLLEDSVKVVLDVENGAELLHHINHTNTDIVILDIQMPVLDGWQTLKILRERYPKIRVIILSMHRSEAHIVEGIKSGARGFLCKDCECETLVDAIHAVHQEGYYFTQETSKALRTKVVNEDFDELTVVHESLSSREVQIIRLICSGKTNREISDVLLLSVRTIEAHRKNIAQKTQCSNGASLAVYAIKHGIYAIE